MGTTLGDPCEDVAWRGDALTGGASYTDFMAISKQEPIRAAFPERLVLLATRQQRKPVPDFLIARGGCSQRFGSEITRPPQKGGFSVAAGFCYLRDAAVKPGDDSGLENLCTRRRPLVIH